MMSASPKFASTAVFHPNGQTYLSEDFNYNCLALDLRKRSRSPSPEGARHPILIPENLSKQNEPVTAVKLQQKRIKLEINSSLEQPTTTCYPSPRPCSDSDVSEISSSDPIRDFTSPTQKLKISHTRPFKAFPKDPLSIAAGVASAESFLGSRDSSEAYVEFRKRMLAQVQATQGVVNKNMRRISQQSNNNPHNNDPTYWEKRRKNNEAAKRSRDARRAKEDEIAIRCAFLEQENLKLRFEVATLKNENERLKNVIYH